MPDQLDQNKVVQCEDYIPISDFQRKLLTVGSGLICMFNPTRGCQIATFGEVSSSPHLLSNIRDQMLADNNGLRILQDKPLITDNTVELAGLRDLPIHTFGRHYYNFLTYYNYSPNERRKVYFVEDAELAYVLRRYRQIHDLTHVLLGMPTNLLGEITVKKFEGMQLKLPLCILGSTFATLRLGPKHTSKYLKVVLPWVMQNARQCRKLLMNVYFEKEWNTPIDQLRYRLNLRSAPDDIKGKWIVD
ncbi:hypothetical protein GJ496_001623 [Pomphorhynchus laevis]|nr:hypothetical protein GJ496_001623 [Pomphorhynchus laevis]